MVNRGVITSTREGRSLFRLREDVQLINARMLSMMEGKDGTIVCETLNSGTQAKDVGNIKNKGKKLSDPHLFLFTFNSGLIEKITAFWDNDTIYTQLGHTETHN